MTPIFALVPLLFAAAVALPASAQTTAPAPSSVPAANSTASEPSKQCATARKKEDREQRSLTVATDTIARDRKARDSCSSKSMCTRYDTAIGAMEKRQARHETRLKRFREDVDKACKAS